MTDDQINKAIAKFMGIQILPETVEQAIEEGWVLGEEWGASISSLAIIEDKIMTCPFGWQPPKIPKYTEDLNAVQEVEKKLVEQHGDCVYLEHLNEIVGRAKNRGGFSIRMVLASPRERCEAVLRDLEIWKE